MGKHAHETPAIYPVSVAIIDYATSEIEELVLRDLGDWTWLLGYERDSVGHRRDERAMVSGALGELATRFNKDTYHSHAVTVTYLDGTTVKYEITRN